MNYSLQKEVLNLRKNLFDSFFKMQKDDEEFLKEDKLVSIDSIIAILSTYDLTIDKVEEEIKEKDEMTYYELEELTKIKNKSIKLAYKVKKEIINKFYDSKHENSEQDIAIDLDDEEYFDMKYTVHLRGKIATISKECNNLVNILKNEGYTSESLEQLSLSIEELYNKMEDIYGDIEIAYKYGNQFLEDDFIDDEEYSDEDFSDDYEENIDDFNDEWKNTSVFNYDIQTIDLIYIELFGEIQEQQKVLIGLMLSDYYEYHKVDKLFEFKEEKNKDVIDTLNFIETSTIEENIQRFVEEPIWADYIIDSYIYYNVNNTPNDKLMNRMAISEIKELDTLKKYNPYINDSLKDETLYNMFITPISNLIRTTTYNLSIDLEVMSRESIDLLLVKYFTTPFLPYSDDYIPEQLKKTKIKDLKKLQLKFIISDFLKRNMRENDEYINHLLTLDEETLYEFVKNNKLLLHGIIKEYINEMTNEKDLNLSNSERQKIYKINKLTLLDV